MSARATLLLLASALAGCAMRAPAAPGHAPMAAPVAEQEVSIPGPGGPLVGTLTDAGPGSPVLLFVPGSGPTDRNGDNPGGVAGGVYRQLAARLAASGVSVLRIDKRGMFGSRRAIADPNRVTLADYADDARRWLAFLATRDHRCALVGGHSEGGLVAMLAAKAPPPAGLCGVVLVAAPGRPLGAVLRDQLAAQLPPAMMAEAAAVLAAFEAGRTVPVEKIPAPLRPSFNAAVQPFLIDLMRADPARLVAGVGAPVLVVQGLADLQVGAADARRLAAAQPRATLVLLDGVNHVLRASRGDRAANAATYGRADLPIDPRVAAAIARFAIPRR